MWYVCDVLYAVLYVRVGCFVVRGCAVSRRYIDVCNCDVFSVVNVYLDHLNFCVVCINGRRYVCCSECNVVSDDVMSPPPGSKRHSCHSGHKLLCQLCRTLPPPAMGI